MSEQNVPHSKIGPFISQKHPAGRELVMLESASLRATFAAGQGASLCSLQWRFQEEWQELLYRANRFEPVSGWRGQAPWLWPAVGRNYTARQLMETTERPAECRWMDGETERNIPIHGFVMDAAWTVQEQSAARAVLQLSDHASTREWYPFAFVLQLTATLDGNACSLEMKVSNLSDNARTMPFSIGNHLTLHVPFADGAPLAEAHLAGQAARRYEVTPIGFEGAALPLPADAKVPLETPWTANAILGGFSEPYAEMTVKTPSCRIRVGQEAQDLARFGLDPTDYRFVLYQDAERRFFCLEPWLGRPNSLNASHGLVRLPAGQSFTWRMTIQLEHISSS